MKRQPPKLLTCLKCSKEFIVLAYQARRNRRFCSKSCSNSKREGKVGYWTDKKRSAETKEKMSKGLLGKSAWNKGLPAYWVSGEKSHFFGKNHSGENNARWIKDRTQLARHKNGNEYRNSPAYKEWMLSVKNRDGWKCKISNGSCSGRVEAHHILNWKDYSELRFEINNGITLCHFHHPKRKEEEKRLQTAFQMLVTTASKELTC